MRKLMGPVPTRRRRFLLTLGLAVGSGASIASAEAGWTGIDVAGSFQTTPAAISDTEVVTGSWIDDSGIVHGFVRAKEGTITSFDAAEGGNTQVIAINKGGSIVGTYTDFSGDDSGFIRAPDSTITLFAVPDTINTTPSGINSKSAITGYAYSNQTEAYIGFVRAPGGKFKTIQVPNAAETYSYAIDDSGDIAGAYADSRGYFHGFLRTRGGKLTKYSIPAVNPIWLVPAGIDSVGDIAGTYSGGDYVSHCFLRKADGTVVTLDLAGWTFCQVGSGESGGGINAGGAITGSFTDSSGNHGFLMQSDGKVRKLDYPEGRYETIPVAINEKAEVTGDYLSSTFEGFVWKQRQ